MASLLARTVAFTGHRPRYFSFSGGNDPHLLALRRTLREQILRLHRENGAIHFLTGMALGVDTWAAQEVLALKEQGFPLTLSCILPCVGQENRWNREEKEQYRRLCGQAASTETLSPFYFSGCMQMRDRVLVDRCDLLLAVYDGESSGGTGYTVHYALKKEKPIVLIDCKALKSGFPAQARFILPPME